MTISPEILAAQQAYAARPYLAYVSASHSGCGCRFATEAEAIDYIFQQAASYRRKIETRVYGNAWVSFDCFRSFVERPDGQQIEARFILFVDYIRSH